MDFLEKEEWFDFSRLFCSLYVTNRILGQDYHFTLLICYTYVIIYFVSSRVTVWDKGVNGCAGVLKQAGNASNPGNTFVISV